MLFIVRIRSIVAAGGANMNVAFLVLNFGRSI